MECSNKLCKIESFCTEHEIRQSRAGDSYYFKIDGQNYRVSNHTIEASDRGAFDEFTGEKLRDSYHNLNEKIIQVFASKTRIVNIYTDLMNEKNLATEGTLLKEKTNGRKQEIL